MKKLARRMEDFFMDIAFAEEREVPMHTYVSGLFTEWLNDIFITITFAETGEFEISENITGGGSGGCRNSVEYCLPGFCAGRA